MIILPNDYNKRVTRSIFDNYASGGSKSENKSRLESLNIFREGLSHYSIKKHQIVELGGACKWDKKNCSGVPLDYDDKSEMIFVDGSDAHTLLIGSTGSKKSRLLAMPMVLTTAAAGEDMVICDPKGEIYLRTAGHLAQKGYRIHAVNLREPDKGDGWNMLTVPYSCYLSGDLDKACEYINDMTINLIPVTAKDPYWDYSARDMLFGLILLLFRISRDNDLDENMINMSSVLRLKEELFSSDDSDVIRKSILWKYAEKDDLIRFRLNGIVICPEKTLSCIISTFDQHMSCFSLQPQIINLLSQSTFDLNDLGFEKIAIYLIMPDEKSTYHRIITIFIKQIYEFLIDSAFKRTKKNRFLVRINFILDEFSSLPMISDFPQMITASRSRNIRFMLVIQSKHQLKQRYQDETDTIMSNCMNWIFLTSRELELLREISELSGTSGGDKEAIISVSRLQHLNKDKGECLIFSGRKYPYFACLPDIDEYDDSNYSIRELPVRKQADRYYMKRQFFQDLIRQKEKARFEEMERDIYGDEDGISDLEKELEKKFDELFGTTEDESTD